MVIILTINEQMVLTNRNLTEVTFLNLLDNNISNEDIKILANI